MATITSQPAKAIAKSFGQNIETDLALEFLRVVENAAIACAKTMGQDEASCVVYGMPRAAFELGAVGRQLSIDDIGPSILQTAEKRR